MCVSPFFIPYCEHGLGFGKGKVLYGHFVNRKTGQREYGQLGCYVPCGRCPECLKAKQRAWFVRFKYEENYYRRKGDYRTWFVTLTYNEENIPSTRLRAVKDWQAFLKQIKRKVYDTPRFYLTSENGSLHGRLHFHALLFGVPVCLGDADYISSLISSCWHRGFVSARYAVGKDFNYVSKYVTKDVDPFRSESSWRTIQTFSKRPPLGLRGLSSASMDYYNSRLDNVCHFDGYSYALPRYLATKVYSEENMIERRSEYLKYRGVPSMNSSDDALRRSDVYNEYYKKCRDAARKKMKRLKHYENLSDYASNFDAQTDSGDETA